MRKEQKKRKMGVILCFYAASFEGVVKVGVEVFADFLKVFCQVEYDGFGD